VQYKSFQKHGKSELNIFIYSNSNNIINTHVYIHNVLNVRYVILYLYIKL
jgi:hypothetical protein